jgi:GH24 family phage-related lysozyme (muramidase)
MVQPISDAAIDLIKSFEGCPPHPEWPGCGSGVTLGYGCDIGADPRSLSAWTGLLSPGDLMRLEAVKGMTGQAARNALASVKDIAIRAEDAETVFVNYTLPEENKTTLKAFPGSDKLPPDSLGALVSLVYNRGTSMEGERRTEMKAARTAVAAGPDQWPEVVVQIAKMVRLWPGKPTASNLSGRRLAEAALFARGLRGIGLLPGALIKGDRGDAVKPLQTALKLKADGIFGTGTMVSVWTHQVDTMLPPTGVADVATLHQVRLS